MGNIVNRVFDSSGPEGKVRGTPQQIIDKYNQLARDAQLSNDRVAFENFQQHAEHYTRMLSEAMREQEARREQQEREQSQRRDQQQDRPDNRGENRPDNRGDDRSDKRDDNRPDNRGDDRSDNRYDNRPDNRGNRDDADAAARSGGTSADVIDTGTSDDSGLVETPESKPSRPRRPRKPKVTEPVSGDAPSGDAPSGDGASDAPKAAE